jgi:superfamily II DNA helicase RecQ
VLPTGGGKSAIYELAGLLRAGPTVVVSPLIALQADQLAHLRYPLDRGDERRGGAGGVGCGD